MVWHCLIWDLATSISTLIWLPQLQNSIASQCLNVQNCNYLPRILHRNYFYCVQKGRIMHSKFYIQMYQQQIAFSTNAAMKSGGILSFNTFISLIHLNHHHLQMCLLWNWRWCYLQTWAKCQFAVHCDNWRWICTQMSFNFELLA